MRLLYQNRCINELNLFVQIDDPKFNLASTKVILIRFDNQYLIRLVC